MTVSREALSQYLADYLRIDAFQDAAPNGLQVEGCESIARVCTAVTASEQAIRQAVWLQADALLVHHGLFWRGDAATITGMQRGRLRAILAHDLNVYAYHLPLDCHLSVGNNACIAERLGVYAVQQHRVDKTPDLLWSGRLVAPQLPEIFADSLNQLFQRVPTTVFTASSRPIERIAWCSGAAQDYVIHAAELGVDAYISGEISERTYYQAKELGVHYFACGHHATERFGIQRLGEHLQVQFGLVAEFLDSDNPI